MSVNPSIRECAAKNFCRGDHKPARLRERDFRHAESIRLGYCLACREYYGDKLPYLGSSSDDNAAGIQATPGTVDLDNSDNSELHGMPLQLSSSRSQSVSRQASSSSGEDLSRLTAEDLRAIALHNTLVSKALSEPDEEELVDAPLPAPHTGHGGSLKSPLAAYDPTAALFASLSEEDERLSQGRSRLESRSPSGSDADDESDAPAILLSPHRAVPPAAPLSGSHSLAAINDTGANAAAAAAAKKETTERLKNLPQKLFFDKPVQVAPPALPVQPLTPSASSLESLDQPGASGLGAWGVGMVPSEKYQRAVMAAAERIAGGPVDTYDSGVSLIAGEARKKNLMHADIIGAMEAFDGIIERHRSPDIAAIAASLMFNENLLVVDVGGGSVEAVIRAAQEEDMEYQVVRAVSRDQDPDAAAEALAKLILELSKFPEETANGRVVIVTDFHYASPQFKRDFVEALVTRRVGNFPLPPGVRVAIAESGAFELDDFPPELVMQSICVPVKTREKTAVDEVLNATQARRQLIEQQIRQAEEAGEAERAAKLHELLKKSGYVGAWRPGPGTDATPGHPGGPVRPVRWPTLVPVADNAAVAQGPASDGSLTGGAVDLDQLVDDIVARSGGFSRHDKAALITDICVPEKSKIRRGVAERLLAGVYGREFAANSMANYLKQNSGPLAGKPTIEDVIAGLNTVEDVRRTLRSPDSGPYLAYLAIELRTSPVVDGVMRRGGEESGQLRSIFLAVSDRDPRTAEGIVKDRPNFIKRVN